MRNQDIARILGDIGEYLEMAGVAFKPRAYQRVAQAIASLDEEVADRYRKIGRKALTDIPGVGASIADHLEELLTTGKLKYYEDLKREAPVDLSSLTRVEGLGPKKIRALYEELKIRNLDDLESAAKAGKIAELEGFGKKSQEKILTGIAFVRTADTRISLGAAMLQARAIEALLRSIPGVGEVTVAGSLRRRRETIGDLDFLVVSKDPERVSEAFATMPDVARVLGRGPTKTLVHLASGIDADLRVVLPESYGAALSYFTGSKDHNIALRKIAIAKGLKLNEYGVWKVRGKQEMRVSGATEEEVYESLGLGYIPPELREMTGEIEAAERRALPALIGYGDLRGDLQVQTSWTDGEASIADMARAAIALGLEYIAITDHTKRLAMTGGLDERRLREQGREVDAVNAQLEAEGARLKILKGTECDILKDGSLDLSDAALAELDVVGISVHSHFTLPEVEQMRRVERAMKNSNVDILFHPSGRIIGKRPPINLDFPRLIRLAKETGTVLEIDSLPERLDLRDEYIRMCVDEGVKMAIDSDAHGPGHFSALEFGIAQARRGWAEQEDIVNAWPLGEMLGFLKGGAR
jgi:DNA polymerase (family 10)